MSPRKKVVDVASEAPVSPVTSPQPSHDAIAVRAYGFFAKRGYAHGGHFEDWLRAERELVAQGVSPEKKKTARRKKPEVVEMPLPRSLAS